jgi:hypothetical protein
MSDNNSTDSNSMRRAADLIPFARLQWEESAAFASRASQSQDFARRMQVSVTRAPEQPRRPHAPKRAVLN